MFEKLIGIVDLHQVRNEPQRHPLLNLWSGPHHNGDEFWRRAAPIQAAFYAMTLPATFER